jgi:hypothetical protein
MSEHEWMVELLTQRIREANSVKWADHTYGPPTVAINNLLKDAIRFLEADELLRSECLMFHVEVAMLEHRRAVRP